MRDAVRDYLVIIFVLTNLILTLWNFAQQTLIASSRSLQTIQSLQQEVERLKASKTQ